MLGAGLVPGLRQDAAAFRYAGYESLVAAAAAARLSPSSQQLLQLGQQVQQQHLQLPSSKQHQQQERQHNITTSQISHVKIVDARPVVATTGAGLVGSDSLCSSIARSGREVGLLTRQACAQLHPVG